MSTSRGLRRGEGSEGPEGAEVDRRISLRALERRRKRLNVQKYASLLLERAEAPSAVPYTWMVRDLGYRIVGDRAPATKDSPDRLGCTCDKSRDSLVTQHKDSDSLNPIVERRADLFASTHALARSLVHLLTGIRPDQDASLVTKSLQPTMSNPASALDTAFAVEGFSLIEASIDPSVACKEDNQNPLGSYRSLDAVLLHADVPALRRRFPARTDDGGGQRSGQPKMVKEGPEGPFENWCPRPGARCSWRFTVQNVPDGTAGLWVNHISAECAFCKCTDRGMTSDEYSTLLFSLSAPCKQDKKEYFELFFGNETKFGDELRYYEGKTKAAEPHGWKAIARMSYYLKGSDGYRGWAEFFLKNLFGACRLKDDTLPSFCGETFDIGAFQGWCEKSPDASRIPPDAMEEPPREQTIHWDCCPISPQRPRADCK